MPTLADWPYPDVMVHRCGGALGPENTLIALDLCVLAGGRGVEFDVMLSAEGTPFVIHDETLERTTSGTGRVCDMPDAVLARLDAGAKHHRAFAGEPLPRFADVITRCRALNLAANVEIKPAAGFEAETGEAAARMADKGWRDAPLPPLLSSFSETALAAAAEVAPHLPRGLLLDRVSADWQARCERLGVIAVHTNCRYLDQTTAHAIKAAGYRLVVYTENSPEHAGHMFDWGVDTVITDRPDLVRASNA